MQMRESVRSGRRENFYVTDNGFIDHYAREMQPTDVAVYHALERYANCHTRSTWVGTAKIAEVLNVSQRTVQRSLKVLEELKLIRVVQTATLRLYYIMPVPPRPKAAVVPLFEGLDESELYPERDVDVAPATSQSRQTTRTSRAVTPESPFATMKSVVSDTPDSAYKEEQDLLNKTLEQNFLKKIENEKTVFQSAAARILGILGLPDSLMEAATAAIEERRAHSTLSMDGIVQDIATAANHARRRGVEYPDFLENYLAERSARQMLKELNLPATNNFISTVREAITAETSYSKLPADQAAAAIARIAIDDRNTGITLDRFYFENAKWRAHGRIGKGQQQFDRIKRARDEAHAIIDSKVDH